MLPLKYSPDLSFQDEIKEYYRKTINEELDSFAYDISLNSEPLYKQYTNKNKLEAGIWFWNLRFPKTADGLEEPFGIIWFSFDRKITANPNEEPYGILVRSKNMLMGNSNSLTDAIFRNKPDDYIESYRELTQTLQGVYGEMLINSTRFKDNARRDWFKLDSASIVLRDIIFEFLKRLYIYRITASKAFRERKVENTEKNKQKLRDAFIDLTSAPDSKTFVNSFYRAKAKADQEREKKNKENRKSSKKINLSMQMKMFPSCHFHFRNYITG